jgi:hypothetical protein
MPPKDDKKSKKLAPVDVDGAMAGLGNMGLEDNLELEPENNLSDDSGDESYGKIGITQRRHFSVYGGHKNDRFYIPPSHHREDVEQGDHVIALNLNRYIITSLEGENIKILLERFFQVARSILPEKAAEIIATTEALKKRISENRLVRKNTTAAFGNPNDRATDSPEQTQQISKIKSRFIEADKYDIHREVEDLASKFISMLDEENSFLKSRKASSKIASDKGIGEAAGLNHLVSLDEFFSEAGDVDAEFVNSSEGRSGVNRGTDLVGFIDFGKKYRGAETPGHRNELVEKLNKLKNDKTAADVGHMLTHISTCMSSLLDYSRTGLSDSVDAAGVVTRYDDEAVLYKAIGRLVVTTFSIFKNINSVLTPENKVALYDKLLDEILDKKKWRVTDEDAHFVKDSTNADKAINQLLLKEGVAKFAELDFEHGVLKMKDPNDPDLAKRPPTDFQYCSDDKRPKGGVITPTLTRSSSRSKASASSSSSSLNTASSKKSGVLLEGDLEEGEEEGIAKKLFQTPGNNPSLKGAKKVMGNSSQKKSVTQ